MNSTTPYCCVSLSGEHDADYYSWQAHKYDLLCQQLQMGNASLPGPFYSPQYGQLSYRPWCVTGSPVATDAVQVKPNPGEQARESEKGSKKKQQKKPQQKTSPSLPGIPSEKHEPVNIASVSGHVWNLATQATGCWEVQDALTTGSTRDAIEIASELHKHVREACRCKNANHVIAKLIEVLPPQESQFVIDELFEDFHEDIQKVARHRYGCRVFKALLEHCSEAQVRHLVEVLLIDAVALSVHTYGNFVIQHLLDHCTANQLVRLMQLLTENVITVGKSGWGAQVLHKALQCIDSDLRKRLSHAMLKRPDVLAEMACIRHGELAAQLALQEAEAAPRSVALSALLARNDKLQSTRYGRVFARHLQTLQEDTDVKAVRPAKLGAQVPEEAQEQHLRKLFSEPVALSDRVHCLCEA